jgi:hypothetical protein
VVVRIGPADFKRKEEGGWVGGGAGAGVDGDKDCFGAATGAGSSDDRAGVVVVVVVVVAIVAIVAVVAVVGVVAGVCEEEIGCRFVCVWCSAVWPWRVTSSLKVDEVRLTKEEDSSLMVEVRRGWYLLRVDAVGARYAGRDIVHERS